MRFWAVFKVVSEKHVLLDADNWQEAARIANTMERPVISEKGLLEVVTMFKDDSVEEEDIFHYDAQHEVCGPCNKCGFQILERACSDDCKDTHSSADGEYMRGGGWCSTKHGHVQWCSQACRDADRENDCDLEVLDRMSGLTDGTR